MSKKAERNGRLLALLWRFGVMTGITYEMHRYEAGGEALAAMVLAFFGSTLLLLWAYWSVRLSGGRGVRANFIESMMSVTSAMMAFHWIDKAASATVANGFPFPAEFVLLCPMLIAVFWARRATVIAPAIGRYYLRNKW